MAEVLGIDGHLSRDTIRQLVGIDCRVEFDLGHDAVTGIKRDALQRILGLIGPLWYDGHHLSDLAVENGAGNTGKGHFGVIADADAEQRVLAERRDDGSALFRNEEEIAALKASSSTSS